MFKTHKVNASSQTNRGRKKQHIQHLQSNRVQTTTRSLSPLQFHITKKHYGNACNEYLLYAKSMILSINEQLQMKMLTFRSFQEKATMIVNSVKKCNSEDRCLILLQLSTIYVNLGVQFNEQLYDSITLMIGYLNRLSEYNQKKFYELILIERIDRVLVHITKSYSKTENELRERIDQIVWRICGTKQQLQKMMHVHQYRDLVKNIGYLTKYNKQQKNKKSIQMEKISIMSLNRQSISSYITSHQQQNDQKLINLQKIQQNIHGIKNIYQNSQKCKKDIKKISGIGFNSIKVNSPKRVSCIWGQPSHRQSRSIVKQSNQKSMNISKLRNGSQNRNSVPSMKKSERIALDNLQEEPHCKQKSVFIKKKWFNPFYLYTDFKGIIRVSEVKSAEVEGNCVGVRINLQGYFNYSLILYRVQNSFYQCKNTQKLKKYLMINLELKKKNIWSVLSIKNKIKNEKSEICNKNVISQLLYPQQQYIFYGYIKKANVYFFARYKSKTMHAKIGILTIYDPLFQNILQNIELSHWKKHSLINNEEIPENQSQNLQLNQLKDINCSIMETSVKNRNWEDKQMKTTLNKNINNNINRNNKLRKKYKRKNHNQLHFVMQEQGRFSVITETMKNSQIIYSNLTYEHRFQNLFAIKSHSYFPLFKQYQQKVNCLQSLINKRMKLKKVSVINRRIGKPSYVKIRYQRCFIKKIQNIGWISCRIYVFYNSQTEYILTEAYLSKHQRYYTFIIKSSIINSYFINNQISNTLQDNINYLIKLIKIKTNEVIPTNNQEQNYFILEVRDLCIEGRELLYRRCKYYKKQNALYIDSFMFEKQTNPKICNQIMIRRQINKISKNLYNNYIQIIPIENPKTSKKYGKYIQFIKAIKQQLDTKLQDMMRKLQKKNNRYYYLKKINNSYLINRVDFNKQSYTISTYNVTQQKCYQQIYKFNHDKYYFIFKQLFGKSLRKYMGRIIKDPLIFQLYFSNVKEKA